MPLLISLLADTNPPKLIRFSEKYSTKLRLQVVVENSYFAGLKVGSVCANATCGGRIIMQSEQLHSGKGIMLKSYLEECHQSFNCVIWDFSEYNYRWAVENGLQNSFLLLPVMNQYRFHLKSTRNHVELINIGEVSVSSRVVDIVLVGLMSERRLHIKSEIMRLHPTWNIVITKETDGKKLEKLYKQAKVCLTVHHYGGESGGEYHRLSETALFGCVQVMEAFADKIGIEVYAQCGGVLFTPYDDLVSTLERVLDDIKMNPVLWDSRQNQVVEWWKNSWDWARGFSKKYSL